MNMAVAATSLKFLILGKCVKFSVTPIQPQGEQGDGCDE